MCGSDRFEGDVRGKGQRSPRPAGTRCSSAPGALAGNPRLRTASADGCRCSGVTSERAGSASLAAWRWDEHVQGLSLTDRCSRAAAART